MAHFGMALGAITVAVIGGAVLLDHTIDKSEKTASHAPPAAVAKSETATPAAVASTNGGRESEAKLADASTAVDQPSSRSAVSAPPLAPAAVKPRTSSKAVASKSPSASTREMDSSSTPSTPVTPDTPSSADTAPSTSSPAPSSAPTAPEKPAEGQPPA